MKRHETRTLLFLAVAAAMTMQFLIADAGPVKRVEGSSTS
jgi:hypothetical protein